MFEALFRIVVVVETDQQGQRVFPVTKNRPAVNETAFLSLLASVYQQEVLCWLLVASIGEMDVLIASLLLFFDNQYAKWSADFPTIAFLASSAVKHSHHEAHDILFLPQIWENRQRDSACWRNTRMIYTESIC